jgi:hypothetical protein
MGVMTAFLKRTVAYWLAAGPVWIVEAAAVGGVVGWACSAGNYDVAIILVAGTVYLMPPIFTESSEESS